MPGLITVKGLECLRQADVIIYDRLVDESMLHETHSQDALDLDLLVPLVKAGKLKKTKVDLP